MHQKNLKINSLPLVFISSFIFLCTISFGQAIQKNSEVKIGKQTWMSKNLNVDKFRNGEVIQEAKTEDDWEKAGENKKPVWCYYNNDPSNGIKYGKLYNWYAVNDPRGLAPAGWHVPSEAEWTTLTNFLGGVSVAGKKIKSKEGWKDNGNGTNEFNFSGLPGGRRQETTWNGLGDFMQIGTDGWWWSATEIDLLGTYYSVYAFRLMKTRNFAGAGGSGKREGMSVRCIKN